MRRYLIILLALSSTSAYGQCKLDLGSQARLHSAAVTRTADGRLNAKSLNDSQLRAFITLNENATSETLSQLGVTVISSRGSIVLSEFDRDLIPALEASPAVKSINLEKPVSAKLDRARALTGIDKIHAGTDLPQAYTGKGVVTGIVDGGFDPNHLNFKNADGSTRIESFCYYRPTQSGDRVEQIVGADVIPEIDTEDATNFHGTHTLGIMAGGYRGKVKAATMGELSTSVDETDNPYYGIAYDSDIAIASGASTDMYVAMGIETILNYSYYKKAPAVINLSLGSNLGPHDGTSALCQYIDQVSALDRVIVCMAAGNEGALPISITKTLTSSDDNLLTCFDLSEPVAEYPNVRAGQTYIYSDSEKPFVIQAIVVNKNRGAVAMRMPLGETDGAMKYWATSPEFQTESTDIVSPQLAKWFNGYVGVGAMYDKASGRYYAVVDCMLWDNTDTNPDAAYALGIQVTGSEGQRIDLYGDGQFNHYTSFGIDGFIDGGTDGTISDLATGKRVVVVGAYNTRERWASLDGGIYGYDTGMVPQDEISYYTSYGTLIDGRALPHVCAPGTAIISSSNEYYLEAALATDAELQAATSTEGRRYSWHQCAGTSMATPVVSGAIALWLEADPDLTPEDIQDIIAKTAVKDKATETSGNPVQWGAGKFDAYAGLKEVLARKSGICTPVTTDSRLMVTPVGHRLYEIFLAGAGHIDAAIHNLAGVRVFNHTSAGDQSTIDLSSLQPGIYILTVNNQSARIAIK